MIEILNTTDKFPLQKIGKMAGVCWGSKTDDIEKNIKRAKECIKSGHGRVLEFVDVEWVLSGISCRLGREWYTHIGGNPTRLQESTRYINFSNFDYIMPESIKKNSKLNIIYTDLMNKIKNTYEEFKKEGVPVEDCGMMLPLAITTKIVDKRNLRNLIEMFHQRLCTRAYWEYRNLMYELKEKLSALSDEWKWIADNYFVPKCEILGYCPEIKSCGRKNGKVV